MLQSSCSIEEERINDNHLSTLKESKDNNAHSKMCLESSSIEKSHASQNGIVNVDAIDMDDISCNFENIDINTPSTSGESSKTNSSGKKMKTLKVGAQLNVECEEETTSGKTVTPDRPTSLSFPKTKRRVLKISPDEISSPDSPVNECENDHLYSPETDTQDELDSSILEAINDEDPEPIPELTLAEERQESRNWKACTIGGIKRQIDMKVIEPYKRVLSHGGYMNTGSHNAIITFSACFLPHKSRVDYNYVMDNLFFYILHTLNQLVTDDYVLVYLHGGTSKDCIPPFKWLKRCYTMIDRKLKKNLKALYLVHTTFWLRTLVMMIKPFISSKFSQKMHFINSLGELHDVLPIEEASIPDKVKQYDRLKLSLTHKNK